MSDGADIIRGSWPALRGEGDPRARAAADSAGEPPPGDGRRDLLSGGKMMLGFVVRECAVALGHEPTPDELAEWANHQQDERGEFCLFGRAITAAEARVILKHPGRPVSVRESRLRARGAAGERGALHGRS
ncbi:MAG: hypothetical protein AB1689_06665 [Thermodesulfobacteriota bacterium]